MSCQVLGAAVNFDAGNDACSEDSLNEGRAILQLLADRLVVQDHAANAFTQGGAW